MKKTIITIIILLSIGVGVSASSLSDYLWNKYKDLEVSLIMSSMHKYTDDYKCLDFSHDLQDRLKEKGIESYIISGIGPKGENHAWIAVPFESQSGKMIGIDDGYTAIKLRKELTEQEMDDLMMKSKVGSEVFGTLKATVK